MRIFTLLFTLFISTSGLAAPFKYEVRRKSDGKITNAWRSDETGDATYYEPSFGKPGTYDVIETDLASAVAAEAQKKSDRQTRIDLMKTLSAKGNLTPQELQDLLKAVAKQLSE